MLVFDKISKYVTKLESSQEPSEFFSIRLDCFEPALVLINFYGIIETQYTKNDLLKIQSEIFSTYQTHLETGSNVLLMGDFNSHIGQKLGMVNNANKKVSPGGLNLANWVEDNELFLLNQMDQSHTHYDASNRGESNVLDLAVINDKNLDTHMNFTLRFASTSLKANVM